jgi:hypothetical protein
MGQLARGVTEGWAAPAHLGTMGGNRKPPMPTRPSRLSETDRLPSEPTEGTLEPAEGSHDAGDTLAALMATGMTLGAALDALVQLGFTSAQQVAAILDSTPKRDFWTLRPIADLVWESDAPMGVAAVLAARGLPPIALLTLNPSNMAQMPVLASILTGDMSLARCLAEHGARAVFRHPAGADYPWRFEVNDKVALKANPDGSVWTPRDVLFKQAVNLEDPHGWVTSLDRSMDALRTLVDGREVLVDLHGCPALERLPDVIDICRKGILNLADCPKLVRLPDGLRMGDDSILNLKGCFDWDGVIPAAAEFGKGVSLTLPDGETIRVTPSFRWAPGRPLPIPSDPEGLRETAAAMAKVLNRSSPMRNFAAALVKLEAMGADRNVLLQVLDEWVNDDQMQGRFSGPSGERLEWSFPDRLRTLLVEAPTLAAEGIARMRSALPDGNVMLNGKGDISDGRCRYCTDGDRTVPLTLVALPPALRPTGLDLEGLERLEGLPEGMVLLSEVMTAGGPLAVGALRVKNCPAFKTLPKTLFCGDLEIKNCRAWDHVLPPDVQVTGKIFTHRHPRGITQDAWRTKYGTGQGA